jgi:hypothetical protein
VVKRFAVVKNNIVENIIVFDGDPLWEPENGSIFVDVTDVFIGPGFIMNEDGTFSRPPDPPEVGE